MRRTVYVLLLCFATTLGSLTQTLTTLAYFNGTNGIAPGPLIQARDGYLYGTTSQGGTYQQGTLFRLGLDGTLTVLYNFCAQPACADGSTPLSGVIQATDGNFYGTTYGAYGDSTFFKITPAGDLTTLYNFCTQLNCSDGWEISAGLAQAPDGNFYGTASGGGSDTRGTVFKITPTGSLTTLHSFSMNDSSNGVTPVAGLIRGRDGNFYGTTTGRGANGAGGTIFRMTSDGTLTTIYSFCSLPNCADGAEPWAPLLQGSDGNFYGTTPVYGTSNNGGTVFRVTTDGTFTTLYAFCPRTPCLDGSEPYGGLIEGLDGNFYGTTELGGAYGGGTIFRITPSGMLTTLHSFRGPDGSRPGASLVQANDGNFYGTTVAGGTSPQGTVFRLSTGFRMKLSATLAGSGSGAVFSRDGHISCGSVCSYFYLTGASAILTAYPRVGSTFAGWSGCDSTQGNNCVVTMNSARSVTATFAPVQVTLQSLVLQPSLVSPGGSAVAILTLGAPAPAGGVTVALTSSNFRAAQVPTSLFIPAGQLTARAVVRTTPVIHGRVVTITATEGSSSASGQLRGR
jgi:uncharacterized repeat protein (TIGR03803 family)